MSLADAFLRDIIEHPDDDTPRLIFADWLDDHDDPVRAEFIRLGCRAAKLPRRSLERRELERQCEALVRRNVHVWSAGLPVLAGVEFRAWDRGFLRGAQVVMKEWPRKPDEVIAALFATAPVTSLDLDEVTMARLRKLLAHPAIRHLRHLTIDSGQKEVSLAREIGAAPNLAGLRSLDLYMVPIGDAGFLHLAESPYLHELRSLSVGSCELTADSLHVLARSTTLTGLRRLVLCETGTDAESVSALAASPNLATVRNLDLSEVALGPEYFGTLLASPHFGRVAKLRLHRTRLGDDGMRVLACSGNRSLRMLDLAINNLTDAGLAELGAWPGLAGVRGIELRLNEFGPAGLRSLVESNRMRRVEYLELLRNNVGADGISALDAARLPALRRICLYGCELDDGAAERLAASPLLGQLSVVEIQANRITDVGLRALVMSPGIASVRRLSVYGNPLGNDAADALCDSPYLDGLRRLSLQLQVFDEARKERLRRRFGRRLA